MGIFDRLRSTESEQPSSTPDEVDASLASTEVEPLEQVELTANLKQAHQEIDRLRQQLQAAEARARNEIIDDIARKLADPLAMLAAQEALARQANSALQATDLADTAR